MTSPFLTEDEVALSASARQFADERLKPGAAARDLERRYPEELVTECAARGYLGLLVPKKYGGQEAGNLRQCLVFEELARADASTHVTISVHNSLVTGPITAHGTEDLKARYLPKLATGEWIGAYALTEADSGSDAAAMKTLAVRDGDEWVLNGSKMWITTGKQADLMIVFARTNTDVAAAKGISAFAIETKTPGMTFGKKENKLGIRASETVQVFLENVRVPAENLLGELDQGFKIALSFLNGGRVGIATQAVGIAQAAVDVVRESLAARMKAGDRPDQEELFKLSELATEVEAARLLTWQAARLRDQGVDHMRQASMAKLFASGACNRVCREAVKILGAEGWRHAGHAERFFRDARVTELYEGTTEIQKLVISRTLIPPVRG